MWGFIHSAWTWLVVKFGADAATKTAQYLAFKIFLTSLFVLVLPVVLNNLIVSIISAFYTRATAAVSGGASSHVIQLSGLAGYIGDHMQLPLVVSILLGALSVRWTLCLLKFV